MKCKRACGFTLVELLSVIVIVAILASCLLPALNHGKSRARAVQCQAQLRQLGLSLRLYADDTGYYPSTPMGELLREDVETWFTLLSPYLLNQKINLALYLTNWPSTQPFRCTENFQIALGDRTVRDRAAYGYNVFGTDFPADLNDWMTLGLGITLDRRTPSRPVTEAMVRAPAEMMAIGCMGSWRWEMLPDPFTLHELGTLHRGGSNVVFCDGHVEFATKDSWNSRTDSARRRWNRDHEPHPETWR